MTLAESLQQVREGISRAAKKSGRNPSDIKLVAVSKTVNLQRILEGIAAGIDILGENKVQEAQRKIAELRTQHSRSPSSRDIIPIERIRWHLIGHLQKNKVKTAVKLFDVIHTVDSAALAQEISNSAGKIGKTQDILVQVKLSDEISKHGIQEDALGDLLTIIAGMDNLRLTGLMTMPPYFENPDLTRPYFKQLYMIAEKMKKKGFAVRELSMGMSHDYEIAIEEGSTMVRVGTGIFGERQISAHQGRSV